MTLVKQEKPVVHCSKLFSVDDFFASLHNGFISGRAHPQDGTLWIYNYTNKTTFENAWDDVTLNCRGLILDKGMNVVARPFKKFFNLNTTWLPDTMLCNLPDQKPSVTEKLDGSLGILYEAGDLLGIATRGSFTSEQALWATNEYRSRYFDAKWPTGYTPLFEIIYKQNRIVVDYPWEGLVLLGLVDVESGREADFGTMAQWAAYNNMRCAPYVNFDTLQLLIASNIKGKEGYVLTYDIGDCPPLKLKIKFEEYVKLHRVLTGVCGKRIWETLKDGIDLSPILDPQLPEGFTRWVKGKLEEYQKAFDNWETIAIDILESSSFQLPKEGDRELRKSWALYFIERVGLRVQLLPVLFAMLDGRDYRKMLWDALEPKYDPKDKPFLEES